MQIVYLRLYTKFAKKQVHLLRASCLMLEIKKFRCYEAIIEESEKAPPVAGSQAQDTSDLSHQCSATEP